MEEKKLVVRNLTVAELLAQYDSALRDLTTPLPPMSSLIVSTTNYLNLLASVTRCFKNAEVYVAEPNNKADARFKSELLALKINSDLNTALTTLIAIEKNLSAMTTPITLWRSPSIIEAQYSILGTTSTDTIGWLGGVSYSDITASIGSFFNTRQGCLDIIGALKTHSSVNILDVILNAYQSLYDHEITDKGLIENAVMKTNSLFTGIQSKITETLRTMPPSGAIAGIYAMVDSTRGVWKAPANVSLNSVIAPAVKLDNTDQDGLNVHTTGKSINAIRAFTGKGTLVWGARTLAGNDNEWRYIPVRRFFIMAEESINKATAPFVFEPNDANTWLMVRSMIENFLTLQWRAGALQGAKPDDAFYVSVGLNQTMTDLDIFEGRMIIEVGLAVVRPAEFIILRFSHKMFSGKS